MYTAAIVEDDPLSAEVLSDILKNNFSQIKIDARYPSVAEAIKGLKGSKADLVFLDMELEDGKGFDVLSALGEISFEVIITTAHDKYMLEAIKHSALDYILKPVGKEAVLEAFERFKKKREVLRPEAKPDLTKSNKLVIPNQEGLVLVEIDNILHLESDGPYTTLHLADGGKQVSSRNLGFYEKALAQHVFFRVHHSHIVNLNHVENYVRGEGGHVVLSNGSVVDVSRRKKDDFLSALGA